MTLALFDIVNRHQIYVEGLKAGNNLKFMTVVRALDILVRDELLGLPFENLGEMNKDALRKFVAAFKKSMIGIYDPWLKELLVWFEDYIAADLQLWAELYGEYAPEAYPKFQEAAEEKQWPIIFGAWKNAPLGANGILPIELMLQAISSQITRTLNTVRMGYANNWTRSATAEAIRGINRPKRGQGAGGGLERTGGLLTRFNRDAAAVTNTITQAATAQVNMAIARKEWAEYEWCSVIDDVTTAICRRLDGLHWPYGKGPLPPAHVGCRSDIMPYTGEPTPDENYRVWASRQSQSFVNDAFDGARSNSYEGAKPINLDDFRGKARLILSN